MRFKIFIFMMVLLTAGLVFAQQTMISTLVLQWDKNPTTDNVDYYNIYTTHVSGEYLDTAILSVPHVEDDGLNTVTQEVEVTYLSGQQTTFYFVVTAVNMDGLESDLSNEVYQTFNVVLPVAPSNPTGLTIIEVTTQ